MSIFNRLFDVVRANVGARIPKKVRDKVNDRKERWESAYRDFKRERENAQEASSGSQRGGEQTSGSEQERRRSGSSTSGGSQNQRLAEHYAVLEVPYGSDLATVTKAWKGLLRKYHPDRHGRDPEKEKTAQELTKAINQAFHALETYLKPRGGKFS